MTARTSIWHTFAVTFLMVIAASLAACGDSGSESTGTATTGDAKPTEPEVIRFGIISTESSAGLKKGFEPFLEDMAKAIDIPVKAFFAPTYAGVIEGMRFDQVEVAWMGNKSAMEAVDRAGGEIFAQTVAADGSPGYWSVIITSKDAKYKTLDAIIEHGDELVFGNGDPNSTSGNLIPTHYIWSARGIDPRKHFKRVLNANHGANLLAVANGQVDFATNNTENLLTFEKEQPEAFKKIHVVWKSPLIPLDPIVWRKNMPEATKAKIRDFMLSYGKGEGAEAERQRDVLANVSSGWAPFNVSSDAQLIPIREIEIAKQINKTREDESLSEADRNAKVAELEAQLKALKSSAPKTEDATEAASAS